MKLEKSSSFAAQVRGGSGRDHRGNDGFEGLVCESRMLCCV